MQEAGKIKDRYGLPISTSSALAAEQYLDGLDLLLSQSFDPEEKFKGAIEAAEGFALAHGALAAMLMFRVKEPDSVQGPLSFLGWPLS